jgi:hypothetical protein
MAATKLGAQALPTDPPVETLEWVRGVGETRSIEYRGERSDVLAKYEALKTDGDINQLTFSASEGRTRVIGRFVREEDDGAGDGVTIVEELLGIEIVRELYAAPYFRDMTDDQIKAVRKAVDAGTPDAEIADFGTWTALQLQLQWQMLHGQESYFETAFVLRVRKQGVSSAALRGVFTGINTVVAVPALSARMAELVGTLPTGEWLYKPPEVQYVQRGIWSVSSEWHWAVKWSIIYGGTMARP